jgi:hypothetical protein
MRRLFEKKIIFSFYLIMITFCSLAQETDIMLKNGIKFLFIIENDNLFYVTPKNSDLCSSYFISDSTTFKKFDKLNEKDQIYFLLNPDCYKISICWREINDYIIPNLDSSIANIIIKGFPYCMPCRSDICSDSLSNNNFYTYSKLNHKRFMVFLISVDFYNYLRKGWRPLCQIYKDETKRDEMYMKLLIPLFDEEIKSE